MSGSSLQNSRRGAGEARHVGRRSLDRAAILALYCGSSVLLFGLKVLPNPSATVLSSTPKDASLFIWALNWWPYTVAHGINPLFTSAVFAPAGYNLAWTTIIPLPGLVFAPITLMVGPVASFNLLSLLAPALTAWTAYVLCFEVTGNVASAMFGGFVFGFSPEELIQVYAGHPNLSLMMLIPLVAYLAVRRFRGSLTVRQYVLATTLAIAAQWWISIEVFTTMTLVAGTASVLALAFAPPERRGRIWAVLREALASYALAVPLLLPYLYALYAGSPPRWSVAALALPSTPWTSVARFVVPGKITVLGSLIAPTFDARAELYFGVPLLAILAILVARDWRNRAVRASAVLFFVIVVLALGPRLSVQGRTVPLPWLALQRLPLMRLVLPNRLIAYAFLLAGLGAAAWTARPRPTLVGRWILAGLAVASLLPNLRVPTWVARVPEPTFFAAGQYRRLLSAGETVVIVDPYTGTTGDLAQGWPMVWQAQSHMSFRLAIGFLGRARPLEPTETALVFGPIRPAEAPDVRRFLVAHDVHALIVPMGGPLSSTRVAEFDTVLGVDPTFAGGVALFQLRGRNGV